MLSKILVVLIFQTVRPENKTKMPFNFIGTKQHEVHLLWLSQAGEIAFMIELFPDSNKELKINVMIMSQVPICQKGTKG